MKKMQLLNKDFNWLVIESGCPLNLQVNSSKFALLI